MTTTTARPVVSYNTPAGWDFDPDCQACGQPCYGREPGPFSIALPGTDGLLCEQCADTASPTPGAWQVANGLNLIAAGLTTGLNADDDRHLPGIAGFALYLLRLTVRRCGDCGAVAVSDAPDNPPALVDGADHMENR